MSSLPLTEAILLEIHQSLGCQSYPTDKKKKFATGQASLPTVKALGTEVFLAIFDALNMEPLAFEDAINTFMEFSNAYKSLELNTWTFAADERQILWMLLGYVYIPGLARRMAFLSIDRPLDQGMPGGRFWYVPEPHTVNGKSVLYLPVAQVVDWLLDLLGIPLEEFADQRSDVTYGEHDGLRRSLYNWRTGTTIRIDTIQKYFSDDAVLEFKGAFSIDKNRPLAVQFDDALKFVSDKGLTADKLRWEIPMTQPGRLEAILERTADEDEQSVFVNCLVGRYAAPTPPIIRQRLRVARMVQDGYDRLLKFLCPSVDPHCTDARQNKMLQLFAIYKMVYNLTIGAWRHCRDQGEAAENAWFEDHLMPTDKVGLLLFILPSRRETANLELGRWLSRYFFDVQPGAELEDHVGLDTDSAKPIIQRTLLRMREDADELLSECNLVDRMRQSSPWRTLQGEQRYWVIGQVAQSLDLNPRARAAAIERLHELAATPGQRVQAILLELNGYLNGERKQLPKDVRARVAALLESAMTSEGFGLWRAPVLQYKAKHLLACNDFDGAGKLLREALEAGRERNYGLLRGEIARDCLALEVANQKLIANNHEKYYREMLAGGMLGECKEIPSLEEIARWASGYFWDSLYKPYPGIQAEKRLSSKLWRKLIKELLPLFESGDIDSYKAWINANRQVLKSRLPDVEGNTVLMSLIKMRSLFVNESKLPDSIPLDERKAFIGMLERWGQFLRILAQEAPKQLNMADLKGQTPLMLMAESGDAEMVKILLHSGADPEMQDIKGMTALHSAIKSRVDSCVDVLLDHPCGLDKVTIEGNSPLHTASWIANSHAIQRLLNLAPELAWQRNAHHQTPLEHIEYLIDEPEALQKLAEQLMVSGRRCATKHELTKMVSMLELAVPPVPSSI